MSTATRSVLQPADRAAYAEDGYVIVRGFLNTEEVAALHDAARSDTVIAENSYELLDASGNTTRLALWYTPGDDVYGMLSRSNRMMDAVEALLDGPAGHYHSKVMQKAPRTGGAWEWHQDYGYWYRNGFLFPDMLSVMIALTPSVQSNGCLQVLPGSHRMGRINHGKIGEQVGADQARVEAYQALRDVVYCEMQPGDALFFHSNLLHASGQNTSDQPRWSIISAYNLLTNRPISDEPAASCTTPVARVPDNALLDVGASGVAATADFLKKEKRAYQEAKD
jgi:ectoine hydroxylase-related dioxygenase (phytanoyl-CoA dioxygenase family)